MRWSVSHFLRALCVYRHLHSVRRAQKKFFDFAYVELPEDPIFAELVNKSKRRAKIEEWGRLWFTDALYKEIHALGEQEAFGAFQPPAEGIEIGSLETLKYMDEIISRVAPLWLQLINEVCREKRSRESIRQSDSLRILRPAALVLSTFCHLSRPNRSTNFQTIMGLYLYQGGARRRVLETLSQFGIIVSYSTLQRRMAGLSTEAERRIQTVGQSASTIVTYDNFEYTEGRRGERTGDKREFKSITTALILKGRGFDEGILQQDMWRPKTILLSAERLADYLTPCDLDEKVTHKLSIKCNC